MRKFRLHKLVRDGVFTSMEQLGQETDHRFLDADEKVTELRKKLLEEAGEEDLPDLLEVIEQLGLEQGKTFEQLRAEQLAKREKMGGFARAVFIETVRLEDTDEWVRYYASEPDRFPEVE